MADPLISNTVPSGGEKGTLGLPRMFLLNLEGPAGGSADKVSLAPARRPRTLASRFSRRKSPVIVAPDPQREAPSKSALAKMPKRNFPSQIYHAKFSKRNITSESSEAKDRKRQFQIEALKQQLSSEGSQTQVLSRKIQSES